MKLEQAEILALVKRYHGERCEIADLRQIKGGARKQVFFLDLCNPDLSCVLYFWINADNYFAERVAAGFEETQSDSRAPLLFQTHTEYLLAHGVNVPRILNKGTLKSGHYFAFVERIEGEDFWSFGKHASAADRDMVGKRLAAQLNAIHRNTRTTPGMLEPTPTDHRALPQDRALQRALMEVKATAEVESIVAEKLSAISGKLYELREAIEPRTIYHLVHGEAVGNHVIVRASDHAVYLVDIEGIHFADLESEHSFLQWVYAPEDYQHLARTDLDPARMAFYKFAMHVSLTYAGSCFVRRGFHDLEWAQRLFDRNLEEVISSL